MRFLVLALAAMVGLASPALAERKVALVIGNADYARVGRLANPVRDAEAIAKLLTDAGFTSVRKVTDANLDTLRQAMQAFEEEADGADVGVIFYSGHGIEMGGINYLIPTDAQLDKDRDVKWQTVSLDGMMETLAGVSKLKLVLLDACRDNPFIDTMKRSGQTRSVSKGLARVDIGTDSENTLIAYATAPGDLAQDGSGDNSPFTTALLKELTKPGKEIRMALGFVRDDVRDATQGRQVPFQTGSMGGEPIYLGGALEPSGSIASAAPDADAGARADFAIAKEINTASGWEAFLRKYPTGLYADLAKELGVKAEEREEQELETALKPLLPDSPSSLAPRFTVDDSDIPPVTECDRLAASSSDPDKLADVKGIEFGDITPEAVTACRKAVADYPDVARFQLELGRSLSRQDQMAEAAIWYRKAADQGNVAAQYKLGDFYYYGWGNVPQDYQQAVAWCRKAADQGNKAADQEYVLQQSSVGELYDQGLGVSRDPDAAAEWALKAIGNNSKYLLDQMKEYPYSWSKDTRKSIQMKLKSRGYYNGPIDGVFGKGVASALDKLYSQNK
jgi:tetratricopeptide (TPR) repeat protein